MKKLYVFFVLLVAGFVLIGCSSEPESFQLTSHYDELASNGIDFWFLMDLNEDGTATIVSYNSGSLGQYDDSDWEDNAGFNANVDAGTWERGVDLEESECIVLSMRNGTYYVYEDAEGNLEVSDVLFYFFGDYSRTTIFEGSSEIVYTDYNTFIQEHFVEAPAE